MNQFSFAGKLLIAGLALALTSRVSAQLIGVAGSSTAPAATYGGYSMEAFDNDTRPDFGHVSNVAAPDGDTVSFGKTLAHYEVGAGWLTWSNGYHGDVYFSQGRSSLTLTLPDLTQAFYFYLEPNSWSTRHFTVSSGGLVLKESVNGHAGAEEFAFYTTGSSFLDSITILCDDSAGFAIGEFGIAQAAVTEAAADTLVPVPEPSTYALVASAGLLGLALARRWRRKLS